MKLKVLCLSLVVAMLGQLGFAQATSEADKAIKDGAKWLAAQQKESGAFSQEQFPGLTGLALWALISTGDEAYKPNIDKAVEFLKTKVQPDGGIYSAVPGRKGGGLGTYNTAICLTALAETKRADLTEIILNARTYLAGSQISGDETYNGGFGYAKAAPRTYADLMNTHFVMEAMRRSQSYEDMRPAGQAKADINWSAALEFAESLHNDENAGDSAGGFAYSPADAKAGMEKADGKKPAATEAKPSKEKIVMRSYGSITYAGLLALVYCELEPTDPRVRSTLDWASRHWTLEENPGVGDQGLYFFYNVIGRSLTAAGIKEIPVAGEDGKTINWSDELIKKVSSLQKENGIWVNKNGRFWENDPVLSTSYSILSLTFSTGKAK
jgi:squalene-hopene/tetraprenyl-beta-curcumene cyclase